MASSSFQILKALNAQLVSITVTPESVNDGWKYFFMPIPQAGSVVEGLVLGIFTEDSNNNTVPTSSDTFITAHNMPTSVDSPTLNGGYEVDTGIYQVSIFTPRGKNAFAAQKLADNIKAAFNRSVMLDVGTAKLRFRKVETGRGDHENGNHYMLPVSVYWQVVS